MNELVKRALLEELLKEALVNEELLKEAAMFSALTNAAKRAFPGRRSARMLMPGARRSIGGASPSFEAGMLRNMPDMNKRFRAMARQTELDGVNKGMNAYFSQSSGNLGNLMQAANPRF